MLSEQGIKLLSSVDFNIGKYLIALNACGADGINYFEYYSEKNKVYEKKLKIAKKNLQVWLALSKTKQNNFVIKSTEDENKIIIEEIKKVKQTIAGLSKAVMQATTLSTKGELDPAHFDDNNFTTDVLENIQNLNEESKDLKESTRDVSKMDVAISCLTHETNLKETISRYEKLIESQKISENIMKDRIEWFCRVFNQSEKDTKLFISESIKKYSE